MKRFINKHKIIEAHISEPNTNSGESWDVSETHGWRLVLVTGRTNDGYPIYLTIEKESELECIEKARYLGLTTI
jgi:hypothetical protein